MKVIKELSGKMSSRLIMNDGDVKGVEMRFEEDDSMVKLNFSSVEEARDLKNNIETYIKHMEK